MATYLDRFDRNMKLLLGFGMIATPVLLGAFVSIGFLIDPGFGFLLIFMGTIFILWALFPKSFQSKETKGEVSNSED